MKLLLTSLFLACFGYAAQAQNPTGNNGAGNNGNANSYSNGYIPSPYEQNQNRPDSSLRNKDTTYMNQQWNNGETQKQNNNTNTNKRSKSKTQNTGTTNKKKN